MKITCRIAEDLLPLYIDDSCSEESCSVIDEHIEECATCRQKLERMGRVNTAEGKRSEVKPPFVDFAKKIKKRRIRFLVLAIVIVLIASMVLALGYAVCIDMLRQGAPTIYDVEDGVWNLTAGDLMTSEEQVEDFVFYTNYTQIVVTVENESAFRGTVKLWNAQYDEFILISDVDDKNPSVTFTGLSSSYRYKVTCEGIEDVKVIVSEGRVVSVWNSIKNVCNDLKSIF